MSSSSPEARALRTASRARTIVANGFSRPPELASAPLGLTKNSAPKHEVAIVVNRIARYRLKGRVNQNSAVVNKHLFWSTVNFYRRDSMCILCRPGIDDFEIAIEEGATIVRVGSSLFGKRAQWKPEA